MKNRLIRNKLIYTKGKIIIDNDCFIEWINKHDYALKVVRRYNQIKQLEKEKEMSKTHTAQAVYNSLGSYQGYYWKKR